MPAIGGIDDGTYRQPYKESEPGGEFEAYHHVSTGENAQDGYYRDKGALKGAGMIGVFHTKNYYCGTHKAKGKERPDID